MYSSTRAIVLSSIKYGENSRVLRCYTEEFGLQAYMVNSVRSKRSVIKSSMLLPLTQLELVASNKGKGTLERIKESKVSIVYDNLVFDPVKNSLAIFLAEVLGKSLKEEQSNPEKFQFISDACQMLYGLEKTSAHFHISFLLGLSRYLGFYPDVASAKRGVYFDLSEGIFLQNTPLHPHYMDEEVTKGLKTLLNSTLADEHVRLPKAVRKQLLYDFLAYYKFHVDGFGDLKSLEILEELFT